MQSSYIGGRAWRVGALLLLKDVIIEVDEKSWIMERYENSSRWLCTPKKRMTLLA